jgi:hypothetical protein
MNHSLVPCLTLGSLFLVLSCAGQGPPVSPVASLGEDAAIASLTGGDAGADDATDEDPTWDGGSVLVDDASTPYVPEAESGSSAPPLDAGSTGTCTAPPGPGDLIIDELMIESVDGTGDYGQWLEVMSTLPCAVNLRNLQGQCVNGAKVRTFYVTDDLWIPPGGTFLVADSADPAINNDLPGTLITWSGQPGDVLRKLGGTATLLSGETIVDSLTWPKMTLTPGTSIEFPSDCDPSLRTDFSSWQLAVSSWFPGFYGTPNAPNDDVQCQ